MEYGIDRNILRSKIALENTTITQLAIEMKQSRTGLTYKISGRTKFTESETVYLIQRYGSDICFNFFCDVVLPNANM